MQSSAHKVFTSTVTGAKAKQLKTARESVRAILKQTPTDANCLHVMALIECQLGNLLAAQEWAERSLKARPDSADVQCHYALILMEQGKYAEAIPVFQCALTLDPNNVDANYHYGNALNETGEHAEAARLYEHVLGLKSDHADALNNLGNYINNQGHPAEALDYYRRAIVARPEFAMAYNNMGLAFVALGELDTAAAHYQKALALDPNYAEAFNNFGIVTRLQGNYEGSIPWYEKALALRPAYPDALNNLANAVKDCGQLDQAITLYKNALRHKDSADYRHNLAIAQLTVGNYAEGWRGYESRWHMKQLANAYRQFDRPLWLGDNAEGKTLFIHAEQGYGDTLQFSRYATMAKTRGLTVVMEVQPPLVRLMQSLEGVDQVIGQGNPLPAFDLHCPMLSLPLALGTRVDTIPATVPYLHARQEEVVAWKEKLPPTNGALRVGLVWAGSPRPNSPDLAATDRRRSIAPEMLAPLMDVPNTQFFNLQKFGTPAPESFKLLDYMNDCSDFADTAALIANIDLVISVDTAVVHLAGAMGKPVWVLNRFDSCWRWLQKREDSPWYPTLRLFNQPQPRDWTSTVERIRSELMNYR